MKRAIYPGSFDPLTLGHLDIIERAAASFDELIVAVVRNSEKHPLFSAEERLEMMTVAVAAYPNVQLDAFDNKLTVDYAQSVNAQVIIRGLRALSDFEYEFQMAMMNKKLVNELETVFMMTNVQYSYLSSSLVREVAKYQGCLDGLVPTWVEERLRQKFPLKN